METQNQEKKTAPLVVKTSCYWSHPNCLSRENEKRDQDKIQKRHQRPRAWWIADNMMYLCYNITCIYIYILHILYLMIFHGSSFSCRVCKAVASRSEVENLAIFSEGSQKQSQSTEKTIFSVTVCCPSNKVNQNHYTSSKSKSLTSFTALGTNPMPKVTSFNKHPVQFSPENLVISHGVLMVGVCAWRLTKNDMHCVRESANGMQVSHHPDPHLHPHHRNRCRRRR